MNIFNQNAGRWTLVIAERNTGIVINPDTMERWIERLGGRRRDHADSLEHAQKTAAQIVALRPDLEVSILDPQGKFIETINGPY